MPAAGGYLTIDALAEPVSIMSDMLFFAHANGFPSDTYRTVLEHLGERYALACLPQHGHDPRFPVTDGWGALVDELLEQVAVQGRAVWGVGHSLGGLLHFLAAQRRPELYRGVIMLDSPILTPIERMAVRAGKRWGFIDAITPAGRTQGRRACFSDPDEAQRYFAGKSLFRHFDSACLRDYIAHGLEPDGGQWRLRYDPAVELAIYRSVPHDKPAPAKYFSRPLAVVRGADSRVVRKHHQRYVRSVPKSEWHEVPGGHMFPFEHPAATARLIVSILARWQHAEAPLHG